jgi:hypothetical protein
VRRWDQMYFALVILVVSVATFLIEIFPIRGDARGMSTAAGIVSGWVGAAMGWFFTKTSGAKSSDSSSGQTPPVAACPSWGQCADYGVLSKVWHASPYYSLSRRPVSRSCLSLAECRWSEETAR